jgi:uncharacterized protein (TIGR02246 family)
MTAVDAGDVRAAKRPEIHYPEEKALMKAKRATPVASLLLVAVLLATRCVAAEPPKADQPPAGANALSADDDKAIRRVIGGIEEAWNAHDMDAYARLLRPDVEWVNVVGMHWRGRDDVMLAHRAYHNTIFKNRQIKTDDVQLRPLCPGYAIAVVTTTDDAFTTPDGHVIDKGQNRQTYVLTKEADGWKIMHCENVRVDAEAAKFDPVNSKKK